MSDFKSQDMTGWTVVKKKNKNRRRKRQIDPLESGSISYKTYNQSPTTHSNITDTVILKKHIKHTKTIKKNKGFIGSRLNKLDNDSNKFKPQIIRYNVAKAIENGRHAKGLTRDDLATQINVSSNLIASYEQRKVVPENTILCKMQNILGVKLTGSNIGQPI